MDAIAGWNSFDNTQKQAALEDAAKRKEKHERLYARAARAVDGAASLANTPPSEVVSGKRLDTRAGADWHTHTRTHAHTHAHTHTHTHCTHTHCTHSLDSDPRIFLVSLQDLDGV